MERTTKTRPSSRTARTALLALAGAGLVAGGVAAAQAVSAQEKPVGAKDAKAQPSARDTVERLFPDLLSEDAAVRARAEREILALGEPGRAEVDRITRDPDPQRAIAALRLLSSDRWARGNGSARLPAGPNGDDGPDGDGDGTIRITPPDVDWRAWQERMQRQIDEMQRSMQRWHDEFDWEAWVPQVEREGGVARARSSGSMSQNGRVLRWEVEEDGRLKVTTKDGPDAAERTIEAPSLEALRKDHPEIAERLDEVLPRGRGARWVFRWPARDPDVRGERRDDDRASRGVEDAFGMREEAPPAVPGPVLGIAYSPVPDVLREQLDLPAGGIVVDSVTPNSLAARLGLRRNDVLLRIGDTAVAAGPDVRKGLEAAGEGTVKVEVLRKGRRETLTATR